MRNAFITTLTRLAEEDPRVWLLTADLGFSVLEDFAAKFPDRFVNVGVAEQAMAGVAAGLSLCGKTVFTYSIGNFPTLRCLEQIRNDICYHNLNVKIVAVGGGLAYGVQGYTHFAIEDFAAMRALPNMTVVAPGDPVETSLATRAIAGHPGPCYLRLGKARERIVHAESPEFAIGKAIRVRRGSHMAFVSTGAILHCVVDAADRLAEDGVDAQVLSFPTVQPLDEGALATAAQTKAICVVEEHHAIGGLSDAVARALAGISGIRFLFLTLDGRTLISQPQIGSQDWLLERAGLSSERIRVRVREWMDAIRVYNGRALSDA